MSSFIMEAKNRKTGDKVKVFCLDDYFGRHRYGYVIEGGEPLTQEQFEKDYVMEGI